NLARGTSRSRSALAFRFAPLPSPPKPRYGSCTHVVGHLLNEKTPKNMVTDNSIDRVFNG
ncbi:MAG: hypothetical protein ACKO96_32670, partial [Flammeovirgaceae bacterium]